MPTTSLAQRAHAHACVVSNRGASVLRYLLKPTLHIMFRNVSELRGAGGTMGLGGGGE